MTLNEKITELIAKLPAELQPLAMEYLPTFQQMTLEEIRAMITQLVTGHTVEAYKVLAAKMINDELLAEINDLVGDTQAANEINAASITKQQKAFISILTVAVGILVNL